MARLSIQSGAPLTARPVRLAGWRKLRRLAGPGRWWWLAASEPSGRTAWANWKYWSGCGVGFFGGCGVGFFEEFALIKREAVDCPAASGHRFIRVGRQEQAEMRRHPIDGHFGGGRRGDAEGFTPRSVSLLSLTMLLR